MAACLLSEAAIAQSGDGDDVTRQLDAVVVTGTRNSGRTLFDAMAPVEVFGRQEIAAVASADLNDVMARLMPSFNVQRLPMNDGLVFVRPATLRNLSPDHTLVLINGHRFHRSALIGARGAQAPDLAQIPASAIQRIEVLRDGASAQYGSEAIAGVINIILDDKAGGEFSLRGSQYQEGDGTARQFGGKWGMAIGDYGSLVGFAELSRSDATSRSRQRPDAIEFQKAHPEIPLPDPVQRWGQPDLESRRIGFNLDFPLSEATSLYSFATSGSSDGVSDFNWRNPDTNASVFDVAPVFPRFDLRDLYPAGFTPRFASSDQDHQFVGGLRGEVGERFSWDVSASHGRNRIRYRLNDSINASLGPDSPTRFYLGALSQDELNFNFNGVYRLPVSLLPAPINIAFGAERRAETYEIQAGEPASYAIGPGAVYGLAPNSNGLPGQSRAQAGQWDQVSNAAYVDAEFTLAPRWTMAAAVRYEDFSEFGDHWDGKLSSRFEFTPDFALRASASTGFRAPTPGQLHATSTVQGLDTVTLQVFNRGRLAPSDPLAIALGAKPLKPETSTNLSAGLTWRNSNGMSASVDLYQIKLKDRFSESDAKALPAGTYNPMRFSAVSFFTNDFDTTTRGLDLLFGYRKSYPIGLVGLNAAYNYNQTRVDNGSTGVASNESQRRVFEQGRPRNNATLSADYQRGRWTVRGHGRYYGSWTDWSGNATGDIFQTFSPLWLFDLGMEVQLLPQLKLGLGVENALDTYPDEAVYQASRGLIYSRNAPYDTDGRKYYVQLRASF